MRPLEERFWEKVENASGADCWQWLGSVSEGRYGHIGTKRNGKYVTVGADRVDWELTFGLIPKGMFVCHLCNNPGCCNPSHLKIDTHVGNMEYKVAQGRQTKGEKVWNH